MVNLMGLLSNKNEIYLDKYTKARCIKTNNMLGLFNCLQDSDECLELELCYKDKFIVDRIYIPNITATKIAMFVELLLIKYEILSIRCENFQVNINNMFSDVVYKGNIDNDINSQVSYIEYRLTSKFNDDVLWDYLLNLKDISYINNKFGMNLIGYKNELLIKYNNTISITSGLEKIIDDFLNINKIKYSVEYMVKALM